MFAISIMAFFYGNLEFVVPFFTLVCLPTELAITIKDRKNIQFRSSWIFLIGIIPSLFLGSFLLTKSSQPIFLILLGFFIVLLSLYYFFSKNKPNYSLKHFLWIPLFSIISGVLGGLFGMAGPPLIFYYQNQNINKSQFRVALLSIFSVMSLFRILFYSVLNIIDIGLLISCFVIMPFSLLGLWVGNQFHKKIPEGIFENFVVIVLCISGLLIIIKNSY